MTQDTRIASLDSLRGFAALIVVISHCVLFLPIEFQVSSTKLSVGLSSAYHFFVYMLMKIVTQGRVAVILFFVLSGYVLTRSLQRSRTPYGAFIIKRVFRIVPVFWLTLALTACFNLYVAPNTLLADNHRYNELRVPALSTTMLLRHAFMVGLKQDIVLNGAMWSLVHEMRVSLLFPLIFFLCQRFPSLLMILSVIMSLYSAIFVFLRSGFVPCGYMEETLISSWLTTLYHLPFFIMGIVLCLRQDSFLKWVRNLPSFLRLLATVSMMLFLLKSDDDAASWGFILTDYLHAVASVYLLVLLFVSERVRKCLLVKPLEWLGRVSYSLYLVHVLILYAALTVLTGHLPLTAILGSAVVLSFIAAELLVRTVENPGIALGKRLNMRLYSTKQLQTDNV